MLWTILFSDASLAINVDVTLTFTYLNIVADQVHLFMGTVFPDASDFLTGLKAA